MRVRFICTAPGCGLLINSAGRCDKHAARSPDRRASAATRGYGHAWRKAREIYLMGNPLCVAHQAQGQIVSARVVDHITPHRGNTDLFWDRSNWQALCKNCHDRKTSSEEGGFGNKAKAIDQ